MGCWCGCGVWVWGVGCMINVTTSDGSMKGWEGGKERRRKGNTHSTRNQQIAFTSLKYCTETKTHSHQRGHIHTHRLAPSPF